MLAPPRSPVEPSWNLISGPPRTTPEPIWAETPKPSAVEEKTPPQKKRIHLGSPRKAPGRLRHRQGEGLASDARPTSPPVALARFRLAPRSCPRGKKKHVLMPRAKKNSFTWLWFKTNEIPFWCRCTTQFRTYFSGDWDVHWGYDLGFDPWPLKKPRIAQRQLPIQGLFTPSTSNFYSRSFRKSDFSSF